MLRAWVQTLISLRFHYPALGLLHRHGSINTRNIPSVVQETLNAVLFLLLLQSVNGDDIRGIGFEFDWKSIVFFGGVF